MEGISAKMATTPPLPPHNPHGLIRGQPHRGGISHGCAHDARGHPRGSASFGTAHNGLAASMHRMAAVIGAVGGWCHRVKWPHLVTPPEGDRSQLDPLRDHSVSR